MRIICLDLEGVLVPEIWINFAEKTGINELNLTTRDIKDYKQLMSHRLNILKKNKLTIYDILEVVESIEPFSGANEFLYKLSQKNQVVILSDTFYEICYPLMKKMSYPNIFCHHLFVSDGGEITDYKLRQENQKKAAVEAFKSLNFEVFATGDSYNDIDMLKASDLGVLYLPPENLLIEYPEFLTAKDYNGLFDILNANIQI